ncbi:MAG: hypothetical protein FJ083_07525 [Cyanobacteria bacterium K_Offshore_surface_m2_239]|nr:hypothetical protein [Cyanobacteria bacterium K_Offshore_surface_m2_239]
MTTEPSALSAAKAPELRHSPRVRPGEATGIGVLVRVACSTASKHFALHQHASVVVLLQQLLALLGADHPIALQHSAANSSPSSPDVSLAFRSPSR